MDFPVTVESQEAFDELVRARLERETRKQEDLQKQIADLEARNETLEKGSTRAHEAAEAEIEKAVAAAKNEFAESSKRYMEKLRDAEVRVQAAGFGFKDPTDALAMVGDLSTIEVDEDLTVDDEGIKDLLKKVAEKKPYLVREVDDFSFETDGGFGRKGESDPLAGKTGADLMASAFDAQNK